MNPRHLITLHAWDDLACLTRPEMKGERVSYPVITPCAARGLLEAILFALRDVDYVNQGSLELTSLANQPRRKPPAEDEPPGPPTPDARSLGHAALRPSEPDQPLTPPSPSTRKAGAGPGSLLSNTSRSAFRTGATGLAGPSSTEGNEGNEAFGHRPMSTTAVSVFRKQSVVRPMRPGMPCALASRAASD